MQPKKFRAGPGPEAPIKAAIKTLLESRGWFVVVTHGNQFQSGLPDLYAIHKNNGQRWIEVKNPEAYSFTTAQLATFPEFSSRSVGIYVLIAASEEEYKKLFLPPNWGYYVGHSKKPF